MAIFAILPAGRLTCNAPYRTELSPDKQWRIEVCARPRFFAMSGSGSDAPGWIVLSDRRDAIRGVSALAMVQLYGAMSTDTVFSKRTVSRGMVFALPLEPAEGPFARWRGERLWRALLGFIPSDEDERCVQERARSQPAIAHYVSFASRFVQQTSRRRELF